MTGVRKKYIILAMGVFLLIVNILSLRKHFGRDLEYLSNDTQSMYNTAFFTDGRYPDLLFRLILKDKTVKVRSEIKTYDQYGTYGRAEEDGNPFDRFYLVDNDYIRVFQHYAARVEVDNSLLSKEEVHEAMAPLKEDFTDIGYANDMLRYSFPLNQEPIQEASAFWYDWYYKAYAEKKIAAKSSRDWLSDIYVNFSDFFDETVLVAVWDKNQELYLMSEAYYKAHGEIR